MNIYSICQDFNNFNFLIPVHEVDFDLIKDFKNNPDNDWIIPNWKISEKQKNYMPFNSSCYYSGYLFLEQRKAVLLKEFALDLLDIYPIRTNIIEYEYYYIHIKDTINSIDRKHLMDWGYKKIDNSELNFDRNKIDNKFIFNDAILDYLCTNKLVEFFKNNNIKGVDFKMIGIVEDS